MEPSQHVWGIEWLSRKPLCCSSIPLESTVASSIASSMAFGSSLAVQVRTVRSITVRFLTWERLPAQGCKGITFRESRRLALRIVGFFANKPFSITAAPDVRTVDCRRQSTVRTSERHSEAIQGRQKPNHPQGKPAGFVVTTHPYSPGLPACPVENDRLEAYPTTEIGHLLIG